MIKVGKISVLLKSKVVNLGVIGEVLKVRKGFARNYLLPRGLAVMANKESLSQLEQERSKLIAEEQAAIAENQRLLMILDSQSLSLHIPSDNGGNLYRAVNRQDLVDVTYKALNVKLPSDYFKLEKGIKRVGTYKFSINLPYNYKAHLNLNIT